MSLAVQVDRVRVRLHRLRGGEMDAVLFVHMVGLADAHPQTVANRLNESGTRFLPFEIEDRATLVKLSSIAAVELLEEPPEVSFLVQVGGARAAVEIVLRTGRHLEGELLYKAPEERRRVLDLLNTTDERFILLRSGGRYYLVQRDAIDQVRDL
jgi:hypothetical protein